MKINKLHLASIILFGFGNLMLMISRLFVDRISQFTLGFLEGMSVVLVVFGVFGMFCFFKKRRMKTFE